MKFDLVRIVIAMGIAALTALGYHSFATEDADSQIPITIVMGLEMLLLGIGVMGVNMPEYPRSTTMIRVSCFMGIISFLALNAVYAFTGINASFYVINGIAAMIMLLIVNSIYKSKQ